jgi:hypothetical protein
VVENKKTRKVSRQSNKESIAQARGRNARRILGLGNDNPSLTEPRQFRTPESIAEETNKLLRVPLDGKVLRIESDGTANLYDI